MFKRVLVLVLFLFAVFWWLTHRGGDDATEPKPDTATEETVETTEAEEDEAEDDESEGEGGTDENEADESTESEAETSAPVTTTTTTVTSTPATTETPAAPVVTTPAPVVVQPPAVPARNTDVKVFMYEWGVDLSDKTIPSGTVNFQVQNDGRFTHDFSLTGFGNLGKVMPNEVRTFTVKLRAGEYEVFSKRRQDYERGVTDNFTVTP